MTDRITPDEARVNELVNDALFAYADLAALDPKHWDDERQIEELNQSREQDASGLTTFMMLRGLVDNFIRSEKFTAHHVMYERASFDQRVAQIRHVLDMVERPEVVGLIEQFQDELRRMADYYEVPEGEPREELEKWLQDKYALAYIRRNALRSIDTLHAFQFTQGQPDKGELKLHRSVYEWWNINSLIAGLATQPVPGVSLNLIRDPEEVMASYFVFAVRNGDTITVLTDRHEGPHPAYYKMSRGRAGAAREFEARTQRHHFPYQLMELEAVYGSSGNVRAYIERERAWMKGKLVPYNTAAVKLAKVGELDPDQIIWTALVLQLIGDRYGRRNLLLPELAYTGEMVAEPEVLLGPEAGLVRSGQYTHLQMEPLKPEDVTGEKLAPQWRREASGFNEWMIERYGHHVTADVLNVIGGEQRRLLSDGHADELGLAKARENFFYKHGDEKRRKEMEEGHALEALSPVTFGSREKLERDRQWAARVNQCKVVQHYANEEYDRVVEEVYEWCQQRIVERRQYIFEACVRGEWIVNIRKYGSRIGEDGKLKEPKPKNLVRQFVGKRWHYSEGSKKLILGGWESSRYTCGVYPASTATIFTVIDPPTPEAIAEVLGVKPEELPWGLQHWYADEPYTGNEILERLDPSDWELRNPWMSRYSGAEHQPFNPRVYVMLSRTAANEIRKRLGLPVKNWKELERKDD
jgi:hypothetical protein